jgi:rhodanese-related sulfurtransferase
MAGSISPASLLERINAGAAPAIVDVRSKKEFDQGHLPGATHVPFWRMGSKWRHLASWRQSPIVVYCGHGPRAYIAGAALEKRGFSRIVYLTGHMKLWKEMKLPVESTCD